MVPYFVVNTHVGTDEYKSFPNGRRGGRGQKNKSSQLLRRFVGNGIYIRIFFLPVCHISWWGGGSSENIIFLQRYSFVCPFLPNRIACLGTSPNTHTHIWWYLWFVLSPTSTRRQSLRNLSIRTQYQASTLQSSRPQRNPAVSSKSATSVTIERDANRFCC